MAKTTDNPVGKVTQKLAMKCNSADQKMWNTEKQLSTFKLILLGSMIISMSYKIAWCPFTKVEESFNLQAIHDLLYHGYNISQFDHLEFPGVVPRTFLGPLAVATVAYPLINIANYVYEHKFVSQYIVRFVLGLYCVAAFYKFVCAVEKRFGAPVAVCVQIVTLSQFHLLFYMSRTLPNTFALILALLAFSFWLTNNQRMFILTSAAAVIVFRAELCILLGLIALGEMVLGRLSILQVIYWGVPAGLWLLCLTIAVDSYFWVRPVWPEGEVLWFNIFMNKSAEWGTSPWGWYFCSVLPRAMMASLLYVPFGAMLDSRVRQLLYPTLGFIFVYSFLPHKELRFIIYAIPLLNVAAARTCVYIWNNRTKTIHDMLLLHMTVLHAAVNLAGAFFFLYISHFNYPGGCAILKLHDLEPRTANLNVHIDVYSAQTGVTRFTEINQNWRYNKSESINLDSLEIMQFTHLLVEAKTSDKGLDPYHLRTHAVMEVVKGFAYISVDVFQPPFITVVLEPKVLLLKRTMSYPTVILNTTLPKSHKM